MHTPELDDQGLPEGAPFDPEWEVAPRDVRAMLDADPDGMILLDCRTEREREIVAIEPSEFVPLAELPDRVEELRDHKDKPVVVYCHHGRRSLEATMILRRAGFPKAMSMAGGVDLWSIAVDPSAERY
ncbi:MAG: rhodanese [Phycisphaeraceae bacterium]|nr:MAG: rhodanese [Phycisphaeraceae bacterium]